MFCRGELRKTLLMLRGKKSGLYVKDIYGTRKFGRHGAMFKMSPLYRELILRVEMSSFGDEYDQLVSIGMLGWPAYKEERLNINSLTQAIYRRIGACKERRLEAGLFYFRPARNYEGPLTVHSPVFSMPLKQALRRRKVEMKKRRKILLSYNSKASETNAQSITATTSLLFYTMVSVFIGCLIVLIP